MSRNTRDDPVIVEHHVADADEAQRARLPALTESGRSASAHKSEEPNWWYTTPACAGWVAVVAAALCWFSRRPLWHTDLWGHLAYGRFIWNNGGPPSVEPLMPLAAGTPIVDTAWLSQLVGLAAHAVLGAPGLQLLYGTLVAGCLAIMLMLVYRPTQSGLWSLVGGGLFLWMSWQQLQIVRPQLVGLFCFLCLLLILTGERRSWYVRIGVAVLFVLWANCHGSFFVGLGVLASFCAGRAAGLWWPTRRLAVAVADTEVRELLLLTALASAAVLLNPYGIGIYQEVATFSANPNLADLVEWKPLGLQTRQGQAAGTVALILLVLACLPPRRVEVTEFLLLAGLGVAMIWASRMIVWWAPVAALATARQGHAVQSLYFGERTRRAAARGAAWTVVALAICVAAVSVAPLFAGFVSSKFVDESNGLSSQTPVQAVAYLRESPKSGQMFNRFEWGDYLLWAGPTTMPVFVASHVHLVPAEIWRDYMKIAGARPGWQDALDAHDVQCVLIDPDRHPKLSAALQRDDDWFLDYEDDRSVIFVRE